MSTPVHILLLYHFPSAPFSNNSVCPEPVPSAQSQFPTLGLMCSFISSYHRAPASVPGTVPGTGDTEGRKALSLSLACENLWKSVVFHSSISISLFMIFLIVCVVNETSRPKEPHQRLFCWMHICWLLLKCIFSFYVTALGWGSHRRLTLFGSDENYPKIRAFRGP